MTSNMTSFTFLGEYELNLKVSPNPQAPDIQVTHKQELNICNDTADDSDPEHQFLKW